MTWRIPYIMNLLSVFQLCLMSCVNDKGYVLSQQCLPVLHVDDAVRKSALQKSYYSLWFLWISMWADAVSDFLSEHSGCVAVNMQKWGLEPSFYLTMCQTPCQELPLWPVSAAAYNLLNSAACLPSVIRSALYLTVHSHFSALLIQLRDADRQRPLLISTVALRRHARPGPSPGPFKRLWHCHRIYSCWQSHRALSSGCHIVNILQSCWSHFEYVLRVHTVI